MCSATASPGHRWDGTPARSPRLRALRVAPDSPTRLVRSVQTGRCRDCGNRIDWFPQADTLGDDRAVSLHPQELPAAAVPATSRWHVSSGTTHPAHDGTPWCRIPHTVLCPARRAPAATTPQITVLRRHLALHTRRLINNGTFTTPAALAPTPTEPCRPDRPVVHLLCVRYLSMHPVDAVQCVSQTRQRRRCTRPVLDPRAPAGTWTLLPATTPSGGQLALPAGLMAVYDLNHLPYAEQLRWRHQHCPDHTSSGAADLALAEWEPFDPLLHHQHVHPRLPCTPHRRPHRGPDQSRPVSLQPLGHHPAVRSENFTPGAATTTPPAHQSTETPRC
ncbi:DUF6083 domain-containing protein (plasmid) [Streptomyces laculatispora]|uniref:DUF6083 domain-containing protein n=2 Tax=Streptomyces laculatispora TaxID=887464 RepID=A0ABY9IFG4_9ACTN|nr:DUF6083 domain-containing protein [Streptomyces laculatispora]WLQ45663.1 DUF6083 domain-containing protein [Streptomyces laculatispora]